MFEISHRFDLPVSDGAEGLWGLDGGVRNRISLSYSISDQLALGLVRSNFQDNVELNAKFVPISGGPAGMPLRVGAMAGVAWNTQLSIVEGNEDNEMQAYGQLIVNALIGNRVALGVVPSYLYNRRVRDFDENNALALGLNGQLSLSPAMAFIAEWIFVEEGLDIITSTATAALNHDVGSFGLEFTTRGHVFKLVLTNQVRMNQTQVLAGAPYAFEADEWRPGFNITRVLPF